LQVWAWNVNGLRAVLKSGKLKHFINEAKPMVLCLNETKIDSETLKRDGIIQEVEKMGYPQKL
jgi:exonuclease III